MHKTEIKHEQMIMLIPSVNFIWTLVQKVQYKTLSKVVFANYLEHRISSKVEMQGLFLLLRKVHLLDSQWGGSALAQTQPESGFNCCLANFYAHNNTPKRQK